MSFTFALSGRSSELSYTFNPPIYLENEVDYEIGLTNFDTYNSIPNITNKNNKFTWGSHHKHKLQIPEGAYDIDAIIEYIQNVVSDVDPDALIKISTDIHLSKVVIKTNRIINFDVEDSLGPLLGFNKKELPAIGTYVSDHRVEVLKVNALCVDCDVASGSFLNGKPVHIIHQFYPTVPPNYKIVESPLNIIYFPVSLKTINSIGIKILDQDGDLVSFQGEVVTVRLHLRKILS